MKIPYDQQLEEIPCRYLRMTQLQISMTHPLKMPNIIMDGGTKYEKTALEIVAEQIRITKETVLYQMRLVVLKSSEEQRAIEEQTLYSIAINYVQLMIVMKLPLDISSSLNIRHSITYYR